MEVNQGVSRSARHSYVKLLKLRFLAESLDLLGEYCSEFLIHAADVEGLCQGIDEDLVRSKDKPV